MSTDLLPEISEPRWSTATKRIVFIAMLVIAAGALYVIWPLVPLAALAAILAYLLLPIVDWLARRGAPRGLAAAAVFLLLLVILALVPMLVVPAVVSSAQSVDFNGAAHAMANSVREALQSMRVIAVGDNRIDLSSLIDPLLQQTVGQYRGELPDVSVLLASFTAGGLANPLSMVLGAVLNVLIVLATSFYLVLDAPMLARGAWSYAPEAYRFELRVLQSRLNRIWQSFFRGQLILAGSVALLTTAGGLVIGLPGALWLGLIAGVLEVVPNFGPLLAAIPALIVALTAGSQWLPVSKGVFVLITAGMYLIVQETENNIFVPRIIGKAVGLPPVVVLFGAVVGATLAGLLGLFLAAPVIASLALFVRYVYNKLQDKSPFEDLQAVTPRLVEKAQASVAAQGEVDAAAGAAALVAAVAADQGLRDAPPAEHGDEEHAPAPG
jgi:predicted PurR-regulated permease PerM